MSLDQDERTAKEEITPEFLRESPGVISNKDSDEENNSDKNSQNNSSKDLLSSDQLSEGEAHPSTVDSKQSTASADSKEKGLLANKVGKGGWSLNIADRKQTAIKAKGMLIVLGLAGGLIGGIIALISFLMPFKVTAIIESIEQRVGEVPQYAIERRLEYYMNRYLIIRTLESTGRIDLSDGNNRFVYLGDGVMSTLYTNWKGSNLEVKMLNDYGFRLEAKAGTGNIIGRNALRPSNWQLVDTRLDSSSPRRVRELNSVEARRFIKEFSRSETKWVQIVKRHHMRKILKRYYGVNNWKPFERTQENIRDKYRQKKTDFKSHMIRQTVGRVSAKYGEYLDCLLKGGEDCKNIRQAVDPQNDIERTSSTDDPDNPTRTDNATESAGNIDNRDLNAAEIAEGASSDGDADLVNRIKQIGLRRIITSFAAGIGIIDFLANLENAVSSGSLSLVTYDALSSQYAAYSAGIRSANDQIRINEDFDPEDVRVLAETFEDFASSPVYQAASWRPGSVAALTQISRDCDDDPDTPNDLLQPGELVCPNKKVIRDSFSFTNASWWSVIETVSGAYRSTLGIIVDAFDKISSSALDSLGVTGAIQGLLDATGIGDLVAEGVEKVLSEVIGFKVTGAEEDADAYDALYAGISVTNSSLGGAVGGEREDTIGGGYLTHQEVAAIKQEQSNDYNNKLRNMNFFARYFSPDVKESILGTVALNMPVSFGTASQSIIKLADPSAILSSFSSLFSGLTSRANALPPATLSNPFGVLMFGFPANHPVFTANNGTGMSEEELQETYQCDVPYTERPQNAEDSFGRPDELPFDVPLQADPCLLEEAVEKAGRMNFSGDFDQGIDDPGLTSSGGVNQSSYIVGDPYTDSTSVPCAVGTEEVRIDTGYVSNQPFAVRLCKLPNLSSSGSEDSGFAVVNSRVSGAWYALVNDAKAAGHNLSASSSYRTMAHQQILWERYERDPSRVARPGYSSHQAGVAIDFSNMGGRGSSSSCTGRARRPNDPAWVWLRDNAERYGFKQYSSEAWHWDALPAANRCDSTQP